MTPPGPAADEPPAVPPPLTVPRLLLRGLTKRCPVCGQRGLFRRWFTIVERCPRCDFKLERIEGQWLGALGMNTIVSFGAVLVGVIAVSIATYGGGSITGAVAIVVAIAILVPLLFFPTSKTLWAAIDLAMRPLEPDDDVDPRWLPPPMRREP